jgi:phage tail P2-like protein
MRNDQTVQGLAAAVNQLTPEMYRKVQLFSVWDRIDSLEHADLDELALELNIDWYETGATLATKRRIIKQSDLVHSRLGTNWAVEQVVSAHFGSGVVREWYEYGGKPYHFKVISNNPSITAENIDKFLRLLSKVKRESAWLDSISITLTGDMYIYTGVAYRETTLETHNMGMDVIGGLK